jgi:hypothetical protein
LVEVRRFRLVLEEGSCGYLCQTKNVGRRHMFCFFSGCNRRQSTKNSVLEMIRQNKEEKAMEQNLGMLISVILVGALLGAAFMFPSKKQKHEESN